MLATYDVFISYAKADEALAAQLESGLENYRPPKALQDLAPLQAFRYVSDMTGVDYETAIRSFLMASKTLLVICSPAARNSRYVNQEIALFLQVKPSPNLVLVLAGGQPNNEASEENVKAYPEVLFNLLSMPLAIDIRGFDGRRDKLTNSVYTRSWYAILAGIYQVPREEMEQREKKRQRQRQNRIRLLTGAIIAALSLLATLALIQRNLARKNANIATSNFHASESLRLAPRDVRAAAWHAVQAFSLDQNESAIKAIGTAYYQQPFYQLLENFSFEGSRRLFRATMMKFLRIDTVQHELISVNQDDSIRFYALATTRKRNTIWAGPDPECILPLAPGQYLIGFHNGDIKLLDQSRGTISNLGNVKAKVNLLEKGVHPDQLYIATENSFYIKQRVGATLRDVDSLQLAATITKMAVQAEGVLLIAYETEAVLYDPETRTVVWKNVLPNVMDASLNGDTLIYLTSHVPYLDSLHWLDRKNNRHLAQALEGFRDIMRTGLILPEKRVVLTQYSDVIRLWDYSGKPINTLRDPVGSITSFTINPQATVLFSGNLGGQLYRWNLHPQIRQEHPPGSFDRLQQEAENKQLAALLTKATPALVRDSLRQIRQQYRQGKLSCFSLYQSGSTWELFSVREKTLYSYLLPDAKKRELYTDSLDLNYFDKVAIGINSHQLLAFSGSELLLWNLRTRTVTNRIDIGNNQILAMTVASGGKRIAVCFYDKVSLYNEEGVLLFSIPLYSTSSCYVEALYFAASGDQLFTQLSTDQVLEWELNPAHMHRTLVSRL